MTQAEGYCNRANGKYDSAISILIESLQSLRRIQDIMISEKVILWEFEVMVLLQI